MIIEVHDTSVSLKSETEAERYQLMALREALHKKGIKWDSPFDGHGTDRVYIGVLRSPDPAPK